ncbi:MAG TPA: hypothetical protein VE152_10850 [Acidimicrobiales bacterium]|nr:hypothetical protein [Acidimicrobiales bacterium]
MTDGPGTEGGTGEPRVVDVPTRMGMHELAVVVGRYAWVEQRLFEILGSWVPQVRSPAIKLVLSAHADHHAWHARLWQERLPVLPGRRPEELVAPPSPGVAAALSDLGSPWAGPEEAPARLVGAYRVFAPRLVTRYSLHLKSTSRVSDGPVARGLQLALADEERAWREGETLVQSLLTAGPMVQAATARQGELEARLVQAGGLLGSSAG